MWPIILHAEFIWLLQCVEDKMDMSQDFTDSPRIRQANSTDPKDNVIKGQS